MSQDSQVLAILFADISGSTGMYEHLGDENAHKLVSRCLEVISEAVARHKGTIVKTIGDEVMCTFAAAELAVQAAIGMQKAVDAMLPILPNQSIKPNIRVGLHLGPVIMRSSDIFGDAVNMAARMVELAKPRQIITNQQTIHALPEGIGIDIKCIDRTTIKGKAGEFIIYEIVWEEETLTIMLSGDLIMSSADSRCRLMFRGKELCVDSSNPAVTLGRQAQNDLVVDNAIASRSHARIEYHRGRFILIDQSTNGTYVKNKGMKQAFVHNDEIVLSDQGLISIGRETDENDPDTIRFSCEEPGKG
ncbi:MAG: adenylate/guanylate cyclase domain-containing protein [Deltaproteobacteria bacterium]|nr:adenylate/guanylate cyclase domain-containing protein [Deltaproteobacteria bacterium]